MDWICSSHSETPLGGVVCYLALCDGSFVVTDLCLLELHGGISGEYSLTRELQTLGHSQSWVGCCPPELQGKGSG